MSPAIVLPAQILSSSRSFDGVPREIPEQVIVEPRQARRCVWCAREFAPRSHDGTTTAHRRRYCSKSCASKMSASQRASDPNQLREVVLEQVSRLIPRMASQIHVMVLGVWGDISDRHLGHLREDGIIVRTRDGYLLAPKPKPRATAAEASAP